MTTEAEDGYMGIDHTVLSNFVYFEFSIIKEFLKII